MRDSDTDALFDHLGAIEALLEQILERMPEKSEPRGIPGVVPRAAGPDVEHVWGKWLEDGTGMYRQCSCGAIEASPDES